ncbi:hypothetical protein 1 [Beihai tombus-like virus 2]|uniref:hypothetical protein 1 n=1 Tax=Beihai tombus-like virus 2 TaxID=1922723 RepID=UPI000909A65B|nr:hypothetical protein 1 [Beihai tombus-like virus 2]APG76129.1 hypothetical protein 1 [Beihai tombus-like virus 2]
MEKVIRKVTHVIVSQRRRCAKVIAQFTGRCFRCLAYRATQLTQCRVKVIRGAVVGTLKRVKGQSRRLLVYKIRNACRGDLKLRFQGTYKAVETIVDRTGHAIEIILGWMLQIFLAWFALFLMYKLGVLMNHIYLNYIKPEYESIATDIPTKMKERQRLVYCGMTWRRKLMHWRMQLARFFKRPVSGVEPTPVTEQIKVLEALFEADQLHELPPLCTFRGKIVFSYHLAFKMKATLGVVGKYDVARTNVLIRTANAILVEMLQEMSDEEKERVKLLKYNHGLRHKVVCQAIAIFKIPSFDEVSMAEDLRASVLSQITDAFVSKVGGPSN